MAKKKNSAARLRKKASSSSETPIDADDSVALVSPDADVVDEVKTASVPRSNGDLDANSRSGHLDQDESNLQTTSTGELPDADPEDREDETSPHADDPQMEEQLQLPPPLNLVAPSLPARRSQALSSASSSCSSIGGSSSLPHTRSLVLNDNATVLQAMPTNKTEVVEVVAEQSWLITKLTFQLLWALRNSHKWMLMAWRLIGFVVLLLPALCRMVYYWAFDPHVHKNIIYGLKGRNLLDVYTVPSDKIAKPTSKQLHHHKHQRSSTVQASGHQTSELNSVAELKRPVVVFMSGGAWIIGYKGWGALLGKCLAAYGIVVVMPDYRNFPQGIVPDMVDDLSMAMQWVFDNVHHFGGDPENVTLVGQSAGAHISMCTLLEQIEKRKQWLDNTPGSNGSTSIGVTSPSAMSNSSMFSNPSSEIGSLLPHSPTWELRQIRNYIGISGPYNIEVSIETFHRHGFDRSVVDRIMDHRVSFFSPALRLFDYSEHTHAAELLHDFPPTFLFHGTADATVTWKSSDQLAQAMKSCGLRVESQLFDGKTHTDIIIEDPISGNDDVLLYKIIDVVKARSPRDAQGNTVFQFNDKFTPPRQYYPQALVKMARCVNPF